MVRYLLDTNVPSELIKPDPNPGLIAWMGAASEDDLFLSVVTVAEISRGAERLVSGRRQDGLRTWLSDMVARFGDRTLSISVAVAIEAGRLEAQAVRRGRTMEFADALIAATARVHVLALVTHNVSDFSGLDIEVLDPWSV